MYKISKILGRGSFGQVYLVSRYDNINKYYAMKKISIYNVKITYKENIINEIRILKYCSCPYIIKYIDCQYNGTNIDIILPYIRRGDLSKIISKRKHKKFDEIIIWSYFIQTCLGVKYLHDNNIIHRDIKSSNILINSTDNLYITDFGSCKVFKNENTLTNTQIGTPYYISPEILSKKEYSYKVDIWSIGCVLYEMICFTPPFVANNMKILSNKILSVNFSRNLNVYNCKYSSSLLNLVQQILIKDENKRPDINSLLHIPIVNQNLYLIPYTTQKSIKISDFNTKFKNINHKTWFHIIKDLKH